MLMPRAFDYFRRRNITIDNRNRSFFILSLQSLFQFVPSKKSHNRIDIDRIAPLAISTSFPLYYEVNHHAGKFRMENKCHLRTFST